GDFRWSKCSWSSKRAASPATRRENGLVRRFLRARLRAALFVRARTIGARSGLRAARTGAAAGSARARSVLRPRPPSARASGGRDRSASRLAARVAGGLRGDAFPAAARRRARCGGEPLLLLRLPRE